MNCKIVVLGLIALCCIQLALANNEDQLKLRRGRSARRTRSFNSSRSLKKSPSSAKNNSQIQMNNDESADSAALEQTNFKGALFFSPGGKLLSVGNPSTPNKPNAPIKSKVADNIPTQKPGTTVTIEGRNNNIYVNGDLKYPNDKTFKNSRQVHVKYQDGSFYVNNNLVLRKGRSDHDNVFPSTHNLDYYGVSRFTLNIKSDGNLHYDDNNGKNLNINYYTPMDNMPDLSFLSNMFNF